MVSQNGHKERKSHVSQHSFCDSTGQQQEHVILVPSTNDRRCWETAVFDSAAHKYATRTGYKLLSYII